MKIFQTNRTTFPTFKIIANGAISVVEVGEGRVIPSIIIDIGKHNEILDLVKLHKNALSGDVDLSWRKELSIFKNKSIFLHLNFKKPLEVSFGIEFILTKDYALIDGIIQTRSFYLLIGKEGDKVSDLKNESVMIEVPDLGFDLEWEKRLSEIVKNEGRKIHSMTKKELSNWSNEMVRKMRKLWNMRRTNDY